VVQPVSAQSPTPSNRIAPAQKRIVIAASTVLDGKGGVTTVPPIGNVLISDGEAMQQLTIAGTGLARLTRFHVESDIKAGRLVPVLEAFNPGDIEAIHAVFLGHGGQLPARVRAFLDYLVENVRLD